MPIPNSVLSQLFPFGVPAPLEVYPSKATLRPVVETTDTTGQSLRTFADSTNPQYVDLPCRKSPLIQIRPQQQEMDRPQAQEFDAKFQVNFATKIAVAEATLSMWQIKIDGSIYQIRSVESDGSGLTSRLMVAVITPFGE